KRERLGLIGLAILLFFLAIAIVGPFIAPHDPYSSTGIYFAPPSSEFPMGTDDSGRDVFSQFLHGTRISLFIGILASSISTLIGTLIGALSGYFGGRVDYFLMRVTDSFMVIPRFFLALVVVAIFGASLWNIILVIGLLGWPSPARLLRSQFLAEKEAAYVAAARTIGASDTNIMVDEILPNAFSPIIVNAALEIGFAILLESELSFLGLGDPNLFSWGYMIYTTKRFLVLAPHLILFPAIGISLVVIAFSLMGDTLNKIFNPRFHWAK
ncbi:MAG: ABC transporter permease, partial [Candidatus Thorarchaeota archaeon]